MRPYNPNTAPYMNIPRKPPRATLAALQWAADRAGLSYGRFMLGLTARYELQIQEEYEEWRGQTIPLQKRLVDTEAVGNEEGTADDNTRAADSNTTGSVSGEQRREGMEEVSVSDCVAAQTAASSTLPSSRLDINAL